MTEQQADKATADKLLTIIREIHTGGRAVIGEHWTLFPTMKGLADRGDLVGMVMYFESCLQSEKGRRVGKKLEAVGKQSLESEEERFLGLALPRICSMLVSGRQAWLTPAYSEHREWLEEAFQRYLDKVERALRDRLRRDTHAIAVRASKLPLVVLGKSPPPDVAACLAEAARCFLYGQWRAAAVLSRATLEAALRGRLHLPQPVGLAEVIAKCRRKGILDQKSEATATSIKKAGDEAAHSHGDRVPSTVLDEPKATEVLVKLRRLIEALY